MKTLKYLFTLSLLLVLLLSPAVSEQTAASDQKTDDPKPPTTSQEKPTVSPPGPKKNPKPSSPTKTPTSPSAPDEAPSTGTIALEKEKALVKVISTAKLIDKTGLSLTLAPSHFPAPNLFVSKTNQKPTTDSNDFSLKSANGGSIFLSSEDLKDVKEVYVRFFCAKDRGNCEAIFSVDIAKEVEIDADGKVHNFEASEIGGLSSMFVRMRVPDSADASRIVIHADAVPIEKGLAPFITLNVEKQNSGKKSASVPNYEHIPRAGWYAGKTAVIYKETENYKKDISTFCVDCNYVLSLRFLPQSQVRIQASLLSEKIEIKRDAFLDGVKAGAYNVYSYTNTKAESDVVIDLQAQEGSLKVFIDCDKAPKDYKEFSQIHEVYDIEDKLIISKEEHKECHSKGYTIVVLGIKSSVYNIRASENEAGHDLTLNDGTPVQGQIAAGQQIDYEVFFPFYMIGELKVKLLTEGKVDLSIHKCTTAAECPSIITQKANSLFGVDKAYDPKALDIKAEKIEGGQEITLDARKTKCFPLVFEIPGLTNITEQRCVYKVSIKSADTTPQSYSLLASHTGHKILYVGRPSNGQVGLGDSAYYQIYIPYLNLESLTFQLTTHSGKAELYVSKKHIDPSVSDEGAITHEDSVVFKDKENFFLGLFWIRVRGVTTSTFTITATAISADGDPIDYATELTPGVPHKGVLHLEQGPEQNKPEETNKESQEKEDLTHFYRFKLDLPDNWKGIVKIVSTTLQGSIYFGMNNNDEIPTEDKFTFRSTKNGLEISSEDDFFQNKGTYFIGVFADLSDANTLSLSKITYSITYFLLTSKEKDGVLVESNKEHIILTSALSYRDVITSDRVLYFKIPVLTGDFSYFITKQADNQELDLYLSTDPEIQHPGPKNFKKSTKDSHNDEIKLTASELSTITCPSYQCFIYLSASTTSDSQVPFTLSLQRDIARHVDTIIPEKLQEGAERTISFPRPGQFSYFTFKPMPGKDTYIDIFCPNKNINIYANVEEAGTDDTKLAFPTANVHTFTSIQDENQLNTGAGHLVIPGEKITSSAVITIMLSFENQFRVGTLPADPSSFSIVAASDIRHIHSGIPYYGNITKDTYQYFMIDVDLDDCSLIVSLESLDDGDSDLLVGRGKDSRPTKKVHEFYSSSSVRSEILEIDNDAIYPVKSMKGQWVFGVYGQTTGRYSLTVVYETKKIIQLYPSVSTEWYSKSGSELYFTYFHESKESLTIRVDKQSGHLNVYIKTLEAQQTLSENLPSSDSKTWTLDTSEKHSIEIDNKDPDFCTKCLYIIAIEIEQGSKFSVLAHAKSDIPNIKNSFRYSEILQPGEFKKYQITFSNSEQIYLNTHILKGSVNVYALNNIIVDKTHSTWKDALSPEKPSSILVLDKAVADEKYKKKAEMSADQNSWVYSQRDFFYFYFVNEGTEATEFKFSVYAKESTVLLTSGESHEYLFDNKEERAFLFYSSHSGGTLSLVIDFCIPVEKAADSDDGLTTVDLRENPGGFEVDISSFSDKTTAGTGKKVTTTKNEVSGKAEKIKPTKTESFDCFEQRVEFIDSPQEGRYEITLSSPFEKIIQTKIRVDSSKSSYKHIDTNSVHQEPIPAGDSKEFEVSLPGKGFWYFDLIACYGNVSVQYGEDPKAKPIQLSSNGQNTEFFLKEEIKEAQTKYLKISVEGDDFDPSANLLMTSAYFSNDKAQSSYDEKKRILDLMVNHNYKYKGDDSILEVAFTVPALIGYDKSDTNTFDFRLCPKEFVTPDDQENICAALNRNEKCVNQVISGKIDKTIVVTKTFEGIYPGEYQLSILRTVEHNGVPVRSFVLKNTNFTLKESSFSRIWDFAVFLFSALLLVLCLSFVCSKIRGDKVDQDASVRKSPKKKGYGFVGEDDEADDDNNLRKDN